uniref:Choline dehydrogenase n=1 Tax=Pyricularia oryzae (strain P131) TaxID=1143193 RepID=L7J8I6_PYRO1
MRWTTFSLAFSYLFYPSESSPTKNTPPRPELLRKRTTFGTSFGIPGDNATFDYVVVGGGNAGLAVAARLAQQQKGTVAVVEAGSFYEIGNSNMSEVPAFTSIFASKGVHDWQPMRGSVQSYKMWADLVGDESYEFESLLPYFEKSLKFTPPDTSRRFKNGSVDYDPTVLGDGQGPLSLTFSHYVQAFESSETSFMRLAMEHENFIAYPSTMAKRVLFDEDKKATGLMVDTQGVQYILSARKEIILSAGFIGTPQLLMVSGVGPADTLQRLNIPVLADRPGVGQGMQDHVYLGPSYRVNAPTMSSLFENPKFAAQQATEFKNNAAGMYTNPASDIIAWEKVPTEMRSNFTEASRTRLSGYPEDWPELEYISLNGYLGWNNDSRGGSPNDGYNYATLAVALASPFSKGSVTIVSNDTFVHPKLDPKFLSEQADIEVALAGYKRVRQFWQTTTMQQFLVDTEEKFPGRLVQNDDDIISIIKQSYHTTNHGSCTAAMGRPENPMAVVDAQARVYGVQNLRVVDASAFPLLPPGHPVATIYALAEKISLYWTFLQGQFYLMI